MSKDELVNLRGLARRLKPYGLSMAWLRQQAETGMIPYTKANGRLLFSVHAVEQALLFQAPGQRWAEGGRAMRPREKRLSQYMAENPNGNRCSRCG